MTRDLDLFEDMVTSIINGTYEEEISDPVFLEKCNDLKEDAEIFTLLHPDKSGYYLIQRKLIVYRIITKMTADKDAVDLQQRSQLDFIEKGLLSLYWLYMELLVEIDE
uniref:hypothetical protein n=1 Tax=Pedobacter schmidteae TaxID=2201271 RepID=UPI0013CEB182|nr:hypothetical protein [Pedobacter schmidteae]